MFMDDNEDVTLAVFDYLLGFADETSFLDVESFVLLLKFFGGDGLVHMVCILD